MKFRIMAFAAWAAGIPLSMYLLSVVTEYLIGEIGPSRSVAFGILAIVLIAWQGVGIARGRSADPAKLQRFFGSDT